MDIDKIVAELKSERRRLDLAIAALEVLKTGRSRGRGLVSNHGLFKHRPEARQLKSAKARLRVEETRAQKVVGDVPLEATKPRRGAIVAFPSHPGR